MNSLGLLQIVPSALAEDISSHLPQTLTVLLLYLALLGIISYLARSRYTGEFADYVTASRNLGWVVTTLTILATIWSGVALAGFPASVYVLGAPFMASLVIGINIAALTTWYLGRRIWILGQEHGFNTPGDERISPLISLKPWPCSCFIWPCWESSPTWPEVGSRGNFLTTSPLPEIWAGW